MAASSSSASIAGNSNKNNSALLISQPERDFIVAGCRQDCRSDGRRCDEFRGFTVLTSSEINDGSKQEPATATSASSSSSATTPILALSSGSARLVSACGGTQLLCSVKAEVVQPAPTRPAQGVVELHVDKALSAISTSANANAASSRRDCDELSQLLTRLLFASNDDEYECKQPRKGRRQRYRRKRRRKEISFAVHSRTPLRVAFACRRVHFGVGSGLPLGPGLARGARRLGKHSSATHCRRQQRQHQRKHRAF